MGGITSSVGIFSGIDSRQLIAQLLQVEARPKRVIQSRLVQLQSQQAAFLDINSRMSSLRTAASKFRTDNTFDTRRATSSDPDVMQATAGAGAQEGTFRFVVDRLVSSRQMLSRGFADRNTTGLGASKFTFEPPETRLNRDMNLSDLNGGEGIQRGKIIIEQGSASVEVDLSRAVTVNDVLRAVNDATGVDVRATLRDGAFELRSASGQAFTIRDTLGGSTASTLGLVGSSSDTGGVQTLEGDRVYYIGANTQLSILRDGNGVYIGDIVGTGLYDFELRIDDSGGGTQQTVRVNLGAVYEEEDGKFVQKAPAVSTMGGAVARINEALQKEGIAGLSASIGPNGERLVLNNSAGHAITINENSSTAGNTAANLGLTVGQALTDTTISGKRLLSGMNDRLASNLNGGSGITGTGMLDITARDGTSFSIDLTGAETVSQIIRAVNENADNGGRVTLSLNDAGNGVTIKDNTGGSGAFLVGGDGAVGLKINTPDIGVDSSTVRGEGLNFAYITNNSSVASLNGGRGIGSGTIRVVDGFGRFEDINIGASVRTVGDLVRQINSQVSAEGLNVVARINDEGNGLIFTERDGEPSGGSPIRIEDRSGQVARNLRISGSADGTNAENFISGSFSTVVEFNAGDTLDDIVRKINQSGAGATASVVSDGGSSTPFRISLGSRTTGSDGRFVFDSHGFDLGMRVLDEGRDAVVFFGSSDPADGLALTSSSNTMDGVLPGVSLDLRSASTDKPVEISISRDDAAIEKAIEEFIAAYNTVLERIDRQTRFDIETKERGPLLGDSTMRSVRQRLVNNSQRPGIGLSEQFDSLAKVGVTVGEKGRLQFNQESFREALANDFDAVRALFDARETESTTQQFVQIAPGVSVLQAGDGEFVRLGVIGQIEETVRQYVDSVDGILTGKRRSIDTQIEQQRRRIATFDQRLDRRREFLERQFLGMERALGQLQNQQGSLMQMGMGMPR